MTPKHKTFPRGYEFSNFEGQPEEKLIQLGIPASVTVPLRQGFGQEVAPLVEPNQKVVAGQIIGRDDESISSPVHSSVNGTVTEIKKIEHLGRETAAVVIASDGKGTQQNLDGFSADYEGLTAEKIGELIYLSGASSCGSEGIPTQFNSSVISPQEVSNVVVQGVGAEVYNISLDVLLRDGGLTRFIEGLKILKKLMPAAKFHLAFNKLERDLVHDICHNLLDDKWVNIFTTTSKYPAAYSEVLMPLLMGEAFPHGYSAANAGVIMLDIQAVLHVYDAVVKGKTLIERTIALCGPGFEENFHVKACVGSLLHDIIVDNVFDTPRFVLNSALTGEHLSVTVSPVDRTFTQIISLTEDNESEFLAFARPGFNRDSYSRTVFSLLFKKNSKLCQKKCGTNVHGELRPCVFCSFCEDVCPAGIIPHLLYHHVENDVIDETLLKYKVFNCVECNLCSYVCPSKIPVAQSIKEGKARLLEEGLEPPAPNVVLKGVEKFKSMK